MDVAERLVHFPQHVLVVAVVDLRQVDGDGSRRAAQRVVPHGLHGLARRRGVELRLLPSVLRDLEGQRVALGLAHTFGIGDEHVVREEAHGRSDECPD